MHAFVPFVALLGMAAAQSETTNSASRTSSSTDPTATCLAACAEGDVNCQAQCVNVPFPDEAQINATLQCSTNECTQGDSGPEDTKKYGECLASCASDYYYVSGGTPTGSVATANSGATGASSPNNSSAETTTGSGSDASSTGSASRTGSSDESESSASSTSGSDASQSASESASGDAAQSTGAAAALTLSNEMITLSGGVVGLVVAALAL